MHFVARTVALLAVFAPFLAGLQSSHTTVLKWALTDVSPSRDMQLLQRLCQQSLQQSRGQRQTHSSVRFI